jgi:hypothetical protein
MYVVFVCAVRDVCLSYLQARFNLSARGKTVSAFAVYGNADLRARQLASGKAWFPARSARE